MNQNLIGDILLFASTIEKENAGYYLKQSSHLINQEEIPNGRSDARRLQFLAGRAALSILLAEVGIRAKIQRNEEWGYLSVSGYSDVFVNISHTDKAVAAALAFSPVGIDLESTHRTIGKAVNRICQPTEISAATETSSTLNPELRLWTGKESITKALGTGLRIDPLKLSIRWTSQGDTFPVDLTQPIPTPRLIKKPSVRFFDWNEHCLAICSEEKLVENVRWIDPPITG